MSAIVLKGYKEGYEIELKQEASFKDITKELEELIDKLKQEKKIEEKDSISFDVKTGKRLLSDEQCQKIEKIITKYENFTIHRIISDVVEMKDAMELIQNKSVHIVGDVIRNGQVKTVNGDLLFLGDVHQGGILRATGNIYSLGNIHGIIHAGFDSNITSVIVGNIKGAQQLRIGDLVDIVDEEKVTASSETIVYVNELHALEFETLDKLKILRPKIFNQVGGI
ncbi:cell division inhibitor [Ligilactobacillus hayakitensis DSM 18933 = JCM 14209]|uniref:Probable septum site-determining protein MinC n=1 Tax=Ligilactobacillus hayakitensis DSM 18933 = JCM 14209 TaxID=1423755 RepID=A0A0R1WMF8_9LACO|nr:septum site-determining protein MinC [Ligilactobacillus hayakitensis]KRM19096.1 cell division inhibitor [Ligilactobacillus hayakitensis DSM 18933 = JCM 14209]